MRTRNRLNRLIAVLVISVLVAFKDANSCAGAENGEIAGPAVAQQQNIQPQEVKALCEHAGMAWFAIVSVCVFLTCLIRHGRKAIHAAPKCAVIAVVGSAMIVAGLTRLDPWLQAIGAIILIFAHVAECTLIGFKHIWSELRKSAKEDVALSRERNSTGPAPGARQNAFLPDAVSEAPQSMRIANGDILLSTGTELG